MEAMLRKFINYRDRHDPVWSSFEIIGTMKNINTQAANLRASGFVVKVGDAPMRKGV
jgi:hypothetical protein